MQKDNNESSLDGLTVPIVTPLDQSGRLDEGGLENLLKFQVRNGADKIFVGGTTGEFASLPREVIRRSLIVTLETVGEEVPVYYGISHSSTAKVIEEAGVVENKDVNALVSTPPYYFNYSQTEIRHHFELIAAETDLPLIIYDIPSKTQNRVDPEVLEELSEIKNIVGVKDTTGDMERFQKLVKAFRGRNDFSVTQGTEEYFFYSLLTGTDGLVSGIANLCPQKISDLIDSVKRGNYERGRQIQFDLFDLYRIYEPKSFLAGIKMGLKLKGICEHYLSEPFSSLTEEEKTKISNILDENDIL